MSTPVFNPLDESLEADWSAFLAVLEKALAEYRAPFFRSYRQSLGPWHKALFDELGSPEARSEFTASWERAFSGPLQAPESARGRRAEAVLRQELRRVTDMLLDLVDVPPDILPQRPSEPRKPKKSWTPKWLRRVIGLKEGIKAGGTLLGTIKDLFESAPAWLKALFTIGKEAADVATGA